MKRKSIWLSVALILFLVLFSMGYFYFLFKPYMKLKIEISPVTDEVYQQIGGLDYVEHPEQENFKQLNLTFTYKYPKHVEDIHVEINPTIKELLTSDVYWSGGGYAFETGKKYIYQEDVVIYAGKISEEELVDRLSKGTLTVTWIENGEEKSEELNMGEHIVFTR